MGNIKLRPGTKHKKRHMTNSEKLGNYTVLTKQAFYRIDKTSLHNQFS